jgi:hypothetical protein
MAGLSRHWRLAGLLIVAGVLITGCSLPSLAYFLVSGLQEPKEDPGEMKLASEKDREVKVVILTYSGLETRPEFVKVDRDLSNLLTHQLQQSCKENREKVTFIAPTKIQEYKNIHPNWYLNPQDVGKYFEADKVVYLEIQSLSLYEPGSANQLYRGRAAIPVKLFDLKNPDQFTLEKTYTCEFPLTRGPIPADDRNQSEFYQAFMNYMVKHLSWYFTAHPLSDSVGCE